MRKQDGERDRAKQALDLIGDWLFCLMPEGTLEHQVYHRVLSALRQVAGLLYFPLSHPFTGPGHSIGWA